VGSVADDDDVVDRASAGSELSRSGRAAKVFNSSSVSAHRREAVLGEAGRSIRPQAVKFILIFEHLAKRQVFEFKLVPVLPTPPFSLATAITRARMAWTVAGLS
jgi:hypothetical protein